MSKPRRGPAQANKPRRDVLATLRMASMEEVSRAALPAGRCFGSTSPDVHDTKRGFSKLMKYCYN